MARVHLPQSLRPVCFGLDERGMSGEGVEKEVNIGRGRKGEKKQAEGNGLFIESV